MKKKEIGWKDIPPELQSKIIGCMDRETRLNYSLCSMRCRNQVAGTDEFIYGLILRSGYDGDEDFYKLDIFYSDDDKGEEYYLPFSNPDYSLHFYKRKSTVKNQGRNTKKAQVYTDVSKHVVLPYIKKKPQSSVLRVGDLGDVIPKYLNRYITKHQKHLRRLRIELEGLDTENIKIDELTNLEELVMVDYNYYGNLLFNTTDKLKKLICKYKNGNYFNDRNMLTREMLKYNIYEASNLSLTDTIFDEGEFLSLNAVEMDLSLGELDDEVINGVIRSWSEGQYKQDLKWLRLRISTKFPNAIDMDKVLEDLDATEINRSKKTTKTLSWHVIHKLDPEKHIDIIKTPRDITLIVDKDAHFHREAIGERGGLIVLDKKRIHTCESCEACEYEKPSKKLK